MAGFIPALSFAALDWLGVFRHSKPVEFLAKPAVMLALLVWLLREDGLSPALIWFSLGILLSLAGDIFLMLPKEQFIPGLVSFLLAHLAYITGFSLGGLPLNLAALILALIVFLAGFQIYSGIQRGLIARGNLALRLPILAYTLVLGLMLYTALLTLVNPNWLPLPALITSAGALLFFLSDALLAWDKFVTDLPRGKLKVHMLYHSGQILLVTGVILQFSA